MVEKRVKEIIVDLLGCSESDVTLEANLMEDLNADSLDAVDLASTLEEKFELSVADDEIMRLTTVGRIVDFVKKQKPELEE